ncbi:MAG: hypothetical protein M1826_000545 [Phylliscum demangeonii]|nr:MAG: hypothetical protein M1826_000545 [Phylliscum demangeonii]
MNERHSLLGRILPPLHEDDDPVENQDSNRGVVGFFKTAWHVTIATLTSSWINLLLVFIPLGILAGVLDWPATAVFVLNSLAIVPLASLMGFATEELSAKAGQTIGGLLNATFGNAVELIVSIVALKDNEIRIVQTSMLGSILSNILLVLGCCFYFGGLKYPTQKFGSTMASTMSSMMAVASVSLVIPAMLFGVLHRSKSADTTASIMLLSRGTSIVLLVLYVMYLWFQLRSHPHLFDEQPTTKAGDQGARNAAPGPGNESSRDAAPRPDDDEEGHQQQRPTAPESPSAAAKRTPTAAAGPTDEEAQQPSTAPESSPPAAQLTPTAAAIVLLLVTVAISFCADYLVGSIGEIVRTTGISKTFIGLIVLPLVANAAEHVTAIVVSRRDKMDLAIGIAIGSSLQIALSVTPFLVILGWIIDRPMTLHFAPFETMVFFLSVIVVNYLIQDGESNYLEGAMLLGTYIIIALAFYVYPDDAGNGSSHLLSFWSSST